ncbi:MAG: fumarylacetoacetate hydrolase family protein [Bacteroidetes bacterium]|nr:fumarylacetoacetate hydrolase family protein [Bacteroidota bacterium]
MKFVTYIKDNQASAGFVVNGRIYPIHKIDNSLPQDMLSFVRAGEATLERARTLEQEALSGKYAEYSTDYNSAKLLAPVPNPISTRDGYAFRQHVAAARRNRKVEMIPEFDEYPIFYFTNHNAVQGPGEILCMPDHFQKLDFELEAAVVLGKSGRNIKAEKADDYIFGYTIMNDMSARTLQMEEMKLNLGPAKGKDFSTVIGPILVTPDELTGYKTSAKSNHTGNAFSLDMKCWVNGKLVSQGNMADMDWTFAEIIERCAYGVDIYPGEVIGSGTVGTGCFLELNGTGLFNDPNYTPQWLQPNDVVEMEITGLGKLYNKIIAEETDFSILALKKNK